MRIHTPVQLENILDFLSPLEGEIVVDATAGEGGHTIPIAKKVGKSGIVISIEKDPVYFQRLKENIKGLENVFAFNRDYVELGSILEELKIEKIGRILFDFGISSFHIEASGRGFSYKKNEPLDMRFNPEEGRPAHFYLNTLNSSDLEEIFRKYGEVRAAKRIAKNIVKRREKEEIRTTEDLNSIVASSLRREHLKNELPKIYQALRIFVNDELRHVVKGALLGIKFLREGGKAAFLSYHSLEDRIIKNLRMLPCVQKVTKKPVTPPQEEVEANPRARSSRLRVYVKKGECDEEDLYHCFLALSSSFPCCIS